MPEEDIVITLSKDGFLRRTNLRDYNVQNRGGKGRRGANLHDEDQVDDMVVTTTHSDVLLFTSRGRVFAVRGHLVPETKTGKGRKAAQLITLAPDETVVAMLGRFPDRCTTVVLITRRGIAKRMEKGELQNLTRAGRQIMSLDDGDSITTIRCTNGQDDLFLVSSMGRGLRISEDEIRTMGRSARGVKAMKLSDDDEVISCEVIAGNSRILLVSTHGIGKITSYDEFSVHHRATSGQRAMRISERTGRLAVANTVFPGDEVALMTAGGNIIRLAVDAIPQLSRDAAGSYLIRPDEGDEVANVSLIHKADLAQTGGVQRPAPSSLPPVTTPAEAMLPFDGRDDGGLEFEEVPGAVIEAPSDKKTSRKPRGSAGANNNTPKDDTPKKED